MLLVELAFASILLLSLTAAIVDLGQSWRVGLVVEEASRTAARVGSARGPVLAGSADDAYNGREADFYALSGAKAALAASGSLDDVERIVIFRASATDGRVPVACTTATGSGSCTIVEGDRLRTEWEKQGVKGVTASNGCFTAAVARRTAWCPTTRSNVQASAEYLGIWIKVRHPYQFPLMGPGVDVTRTAVMRLEPKAE